MTCVPASQYLNVMCSADSMMMSVHECVYGLGEEVVLTLADPTCMATKIPTVEDYWMTTVNLDSCGTTISAENDIIKFQNSFTVESRTSTLVMHSDPDITFTCDFSATVDGVSSSLSVAGEDTHIAQGAASDGEFEFVLEFVAPDVDGNFGVAPNDTMVVGERVYFDVYNANSIAGVSFVVQGKVLKLSS